MRRRKTRTGNQQRRHAMAPRADVSAGAAFAPSAWSALEAEFFARESELYVNEPTDSFDDLEEEA